MDTVDSYLSLIPKEETDIFIAVRNLHQWHCCPRCILRFLGQRDHFSYKKSNEELAKWVDECIKAATDSKPEVNVDDAAVNVEETTKEVSMEQSSSSDDQQNGSVKDVVCVSCIGVLQNTFCAQDFYNKLHSCIKKEDFEFDSYYLSLSIPVPLMVREYALFIKLKEVLPNVYDDLVREDITPIKEAWKWASGGTMTHLLKKPFDQKSNFEVKLNFSHPELEKECNFFFDAFPDVFCRRKNNKHGWEVFTRVNVPKALDDLGDKGFQRYYQCPPKPKQLPLTCDSIVCVHEAVFAAGRYNKYSRQLSQTPWVVDGERRTESSVEEMICVHLKDLFLCKEYKMSASGREDVDVLMLGRGRPFVVEIINPRRIHFTAEMMRSIQDKINSTHSEVRVRDLQMVTREDTSHLKQGEQEKIKQYSALCSINTAITQEQLDSILHPIKDLVIEQKTPIRVLHRRSLAVRDRMIHRISAEVKDAQLFSVRMATQAGTYIKEFVHGDFGRTTPNLGTLLSAECDILELNVDAVELDWPKQLEDLDT